MKRIYACLGIVAALLAVAFYSSFRVQMFAEDISGDIDHAMEAIREDDLTGRLAQARSMALSTFCRSKGSRELSFLMTISGTVSTTS